jgi:hypothetical protein
MLSEEKWEELVALEVEVSLRIQAALMEDLEDRILHGHAIEAESVVVEPKQLEAGFGR